MSSTSGNRVGSCFDQQGQIQPRVSSRSCSDILLCRRKPAESWSLLRKTSAGQGAGTESACPPVASERRKAESPLLAGTAKYAKNTKGEGTGVGSHGTERIQNPDGHDSIQDEERGRLACTVRRPAGQPGAQVQARGKRVWCTMRKPSAGRRWLQPGRSRSPRKNCGSTWGLNQNCRRA